MVEHNRLCEWFAVTKISEVIHFQQKLTIPEDSDYWLGMGRYHNFGFGTIPECNTLVSIPKHVHASESPSLQVSSNTAI